MKTVVFVLSITLAGYGFAHADPPAKQPTPKAAREVSDLKQVVNSFGLHLGYRGATDKPYYHLILSVRGGWGTPNRSYQQATITKEQAESIIDYLGTEGFLDRAVEADHFVRPTKPGYTMNVHVDDAGSYEDLGWGLPMLKRLDGLRKVLDGDAAKKMDLLLGGLAGHRKEWEKEEAKAKPADAAPVNQNAATRTKASMKGWELYIWQQGGDTYFSLLPGTNRLKTDEEIKTAAVKGIEAVKPKLDELNQGQMVLLCGRHLPDRAPDGPAKEAREYCKKIGMDVQR